MEVIEILLAEPVSDEADSLVSSNDPDDLENEQTWPTEEEMNGKNGTGSPEDPSIPDAIPGTTPKSVKRIPKGMSEYQAAWIIDETDGEDADDNASQGSGDEAMADEEMEEMVDVEDTTDMDTENQRGVRFQDLDIEEETAQ